MNAELFQKTIDCVEKALTDAKIEKGDVNDIIIVGGASRTPEVIIITYVYFLIIWISIKKYNYY